MADTPYTEKRFSQVRGPQSSEDYNLRVEQNFKDLVYIYNKMNIINSDLDKGFSNFVKDLLSIAKGMQAYEMRLQAVEAGYKKVGFYSANQIDNDRFDLIPAYAISETGRCTFNENAGLITLPKVQSTSISKVKFTNDDGTFAIPASLETNVIQDASTLDSASALIDTSQPYNALLDVPGKIWDRNVIVTSPSSTGAACWFYIKVPNDLSIVADTNGLIMNPFPLKGTDILSIDYTTSGNPKLNNSESWTPLNDAARYSGNNQAIGHVPPGGWAGDSILGSGPKTFYFDPKPISAFRIKLQQKNYFQEGLSYIYSYGLSKLDIRYDKFLDTGKTIIRFNAPAGDTISSIREIQPKIWNVPEYSVNNIFSIRTIWETSFNSGTYTLTPVPFSSRVWVEVTLNKTPAGGTPSLSGLVISYR